MRYAARLILVLILTPLATAWGQGSSATTAQGEPVDLVKSEAQLAQRFDQLEMLAGRLAELSRTTQPRRAQLLRELIQRSREQDVPGQFDAIASLLDERQFSAAIERQDQLEKHLQGLLELLLQEDRDRQIESERKRIGRYLQEMNRLIRLQRGIRARTDGGDDGDRLVQDQARVGDQTERLRDEIESTELDTEKQSPAEAADAQQAGGDSADASEDADDNSQQQSPDENGEPDKPSGADSQPSPSEAQDQSPSEGSPPQDGQPGQSPPSPQGSPSQGAPSDGEPSGGQPSGGESQSPQQPPPDEPMNRAAQRLQQAQQRMHQAQQQLEQAAQDGALQEQQQALSDLEQAKAELERILRQLREEELERTLASLESRFRRMLDAQIAVYEETQKLASLPEATPPHEVEIAAGRQSRREQQIVAEADRALLLLREDGTSAAFPEAVQQMRQDMQDIAERLLRTRVGLITQGLEEDVIAALEEALAVLQKSLEELREQRQQQAQQGSSGEPGEQSLVDSLEELRMVRSLQVRVNNRTESYGRLIDGPQANDPELLRALDNLADRQLRIWRATRDLGAGENQ